MPGARSPSTANAALDALLAEEFPVERDCVYLNHAGVAPLPRRAGRAVAEFAARYVQRGARDYEAWLATERTVREQLRALVNAPSADDIALLKNTSEALSLVAAGFPWRPGDNVVITHEEFPSNRIVWEALADRGVSVREVDLAAAPDYEQALAAAADARTRLMAVSSVQYASGRRLRLEALGEFCRRRGIALCVDAIQSLGAVRVDVQACRVDFLAADAHKWMLGPEGIALFYCTPAWRERLALVEFGWHMTERPDDFERRTWRPARTARRFECGSPNMLGIHALSASLSLLLEIGLEALERRVLARAAWLLEALGRRRDTALITPAEPGRYAGIVTFRPARGSAARLHRHLERHGVVCARRGGGIRLSPHCYTRFEALERVLGIVDKYI